MSIPNETKDLVSALFKNGLTDNEQLQKLLWNLKEIAELSNEELGVKECIDIKTFFVSYLTELANQYRPTNSSKFPERILSIDSSFSNISIGIQESFASLLEKLPPSPDEDSNHRIYECLSEIRNRCQEEALRAKNVTDEWLREIRY